MCTDCTLNLFDFEFFDHQNARDLDATDMMAVFAQGTVGKRLRYRDLITDKGLAS